MYRLNWPLIRYIFGILLLMETVFLAVSAGVSIWYSHTEGDQDWPAFLITTLLTGMTGTVFFLTGRKHSTHITTREGFFVVSLAWVLFTLFGMLPYLFYGTCTSVTDAVVETMSGFTTTGCTILENIEEQPHGILFWRGLTQWLGGLGIVVFSLALLPIIGTGATQIFGAETNGLSVDKLRPRIDATARRLWTIYFTLTSANALLYWVCGMSKYDAIVHSFSTMASGGFSTYQDSIGHFHSPAIEYVCCLFLFITSVNFNLFYFVGVGRWRVFWRNEEFRWFVWLVGGLTLLFMCLNACVRNADWATAQQVAALGDGSLETTLRTSLFHVLTIISSAGFQAENFDYDLWGPLFWIPTLFLMAVGGCTSSTAAGLKVVRFVVLMKNVRNEFMQALQPRTYTSVKLNGQTLAAETVYKVTAMLLVYIVLVVVSIFLLQLMGLDFETSIGSTFSAFGNIGPALGTAGPATTWASLPMLAKWYLSAAMLVGRLEIFTVVLIFTPMFWRK